MEKALLKFPKENFNKPAPATERPLIFVRETNLEEPHSILHYIRENPELDPQYQNWEWAIKNYLAGN